MLNVDQFHHHYHHHYSHRYYYRRHHNRYYHRQSDCHCHRQSYRHHILFRLSLSQAALTLLPWET